MRRILVHLVLGALTVAGGGIAAWGAGILLSAAGSDEWPTVEGTVGLTDILLTTGSTGSGSRTTNYYYHPYVEYRYEFGGRTYTSDRIGFVDEGFGDRAEAEAEIRRLVADDRVTVHVDPDDPSRSVLRPGAGWTTALPMAFGLFLLVSSAAGLAAFHLLSRPGRGE